MIAEILHCSRREISEMVRRAQPVSTERSAVLKTSTRTVIISMLCFYRSCAFIVIESGPDAGRKGKK